MVYMTCQDAGGLHSISAMSTPNLCGCNNIVCTCTSSLQIIKVIMQLVNNHCWY